MTRLPHELRRTGMFSPGWDLKGPKLNGRFDPPEDGRPGAYQGTGLRLLYQLSEGRKVQVEFRSPRLARAGDRIEGRVVLAGSDRGVHIKNRGTGNEFVTMQIATSGWIRRRMVLLDPSGTLLVSMHRHSGHFDVDVAAAPFEAARAKPGGGLRRLYEASIAMLIASRIEQERRRRAGMTAAGAGAAAAGAGAAGGIAAYKAMERRRH